jgi:hypothetical protein
MLLLSVGMVFERKLVGLLPFRNVYSVFENPMMLPYTNCFSFANSFPLGLQISIPLT